MSETETVLLRHGSCELRDEDVAYIRGFLADFPTLSRTETILTLAEHLGWTTPAGGARSAAATQRLEQTGAIRLPALDTRYQTTAGKKLRPRKEVPVYAGAPVESSLAALGPVQLRLLTACAEQTRFDAYLGTFHPLGHTSGRGLARPGHRYRSTPKRILVKPLMRQWRERLCSDALATGASSHEHTIPRSAAQGRGRTPR